MNQQTFICDCHSFDHQATFYYDEEEKKVFVTFHLITHKNILKRLISALGYVFNLRSFYGQFDEFILKPEDEEKILDFLENKN